MPSRSISSKTTPLYSIFLSGNLFQLLCQFCGARSSVGLDDADHDVLSALMPADRLTQHVVRLANAGRVAEEELEGAARLLRRNLFEPFFRALYCGDTSCRECP